MPRVISIGSTVSMVDFTDYYDRTVGAITIDDNFDKTTRSVSCRFALVNPPSVPTPYQIVEIYYPDQETGSGSNTIFSGIIKSITKRIAAYHPVNANTAVYDIVAESWEVRGSDFELINYAEFYSQKFGYIVKSIIDNYLPHLDSSSLSGTEGPTLERVIFVNRRPNEAITQLCEKSGYYWYVTPDRKVYINYIGGTNFSPLVIADNSIQHRKIDLQLVDNIDSKINDLFLRIASIKGAFTQQQIPLDGFTGNYPLRAKPYGLADVVPIVDEFNGGDTPTYPDEGKWNVEDDEQLLYLQDGRLQISKGSTPGMITSRSLIGTSNTIYARNLETEIISIDAGGYLCMGLHTGEASTDVSKILLGIQIEPNVDPTKGDIKIRKGATLSSVVYTMDFNVGDPKPYQFRILVQGGVYYIQVQDPDDLASGKPSYTQIDSDVISLPDYVSYCPALTSSDVEATVIQGAVILKPEFYAWLAEEQNITSVGEKDTVYITCEHANWSKWLLKGTLVYFYDRDGVEYSVNPISGLPFMIEGNNTQQIFVFSTPPVSWFTTNNIQALRIAQRPLIISNSSANDYEIHAFIEEIQGTPMFRFFAGEIPCGQLYVEYWTDQPKTLRVYDEASINYFLSISGIPSDTGHRKEFLDVSKSVTTLNELLEYAKTYLQSNLHSFVEGTIETDTNLIGTSARIRSGMNQSISGLTIGEEYISTTDSYISRVSMTDVGGNQFKYTISLGDLQDYIHSLFITKLNVLHQEELFIDDLGNNERLEYDDIVEIGDIDNRLDSPYFTSYYFGSDGIYLAWSTVSGAAQYELRLDDSKGTQGTGFLYRGTNTTYSITGSDVKRRKYRFYIYSIDASGNYSKLPYVVTVENKQPTTTPLRDILVSNEGVITVVFRMPFETDVNKRVVYVNNQAVADDDLASSDIIFELAPWEPSVEFMSYDTTLYVSVVEQDPWYALDTKPIRFDRIIATNIITKPPEEPVGWQIQTHADDETLQTSQIRLRFPYLTDPSYGRPKVFHVQFKEDGVFPDPNDGLPNGTAEAILETANSSEVKLPLGALSGMGSLIPSDYLMVLHTTFPTIDGSYTKDWYIGRFIVDVTDDGVNDIVTVSGEFPIDAADDYDWQIWSKWYNDCDLFREYPVSRDTYIFAAEYYEFIDELNDWSGYARVYAVNDFGLIGPVDFGSLITTSPIGTSDVPAPLVTDFTVTPDGFMGPDGAQKVWCEITWTAPDPLENYDHVLVIADYPNEDDMGAGADSGYAGAGYYVNRVGEFRESGSPFVSTPTDADVIFYCISVNKDGYYDPDWYANGKDQPGGYREYKVTLAPDNTAPGAPTNVIATLTTAGMFNVAWDDLDLLDLRTYQVEVKSAATQGGLAGASYGGTRDTGRSTFCQHEIDDNGYWYKFRVRAIDTVGNEGAWGESADVQGYHGLILQPVSVPTNLSVSTSGEYMVGVPFVHVSVNWDNPVDANYGGCEVWLWHYDAAETTVEFVTQHDRVLVSETSSSLITLPADKSKVRAVLLPFNTTGIVPDYTTYAQSDIFALDPDVTGLPAPDVTARDGIGRVSLSVEIPAWTDNEAPYSELEIYVNSSNASAGSVYVMSVPVGHAQGSTSRESVEVPYAIMADVTGSWAYDTQYYWFARLRTKDGTQSAYSADTDNSALFISGAKTDTGAPDFASGAEIMRFACADRQVRIAWNAPTVCGDSVYLSEIEVSSSSSFTSATRLALAGLNMKSGVWTFVPAANGTFYIRIRFYNNSAAGVSEWFGRVEGTAYATVQTQADQTGDTGKMSGTDVEYQTTDLTGKDNIQLDVRLKSTAANAKTCYNISVIWSATLNNTKDENNVYQSGLTAAWQDNDSWVAVNTTPATAWIGKVLQFYSATNVWDGWIITQIDATNKRVQLNGSFGAAKSGQTARVITPYWQRANTWFKEIGKDFGYHIEKNVWYPTTITEIPSGATCYVRLIPCNVYGCGTAKDISFTIPDDVGIIADKGQAYANDTAPAGTFSSGGYQWEVAANNTVDFVKTFSFAQHADEMYRADSFVICIRTGGGTPDPTTDKLLVFPVAHLTGSQDYELKVPNLDPFTTYSFTLYQAKNTVSGLSLNTSGTSGKFLTDTGIKSTTSNDVVIKLPSSVTNGYVLFKGYNNYTTHRFGTSAQAGSYYGFLHLLKHDGNKALEIIYNSGTVEFSSDLASEYYFDASVNVAGTLQCDALRIDATPATATITPDKVIEISMSGTIYQVPCKVKP